MRLTKYHKNLLQKLFANWFLEKIGDEYLLRRSLGTGRANKEIFLVKKVKRPTVIILIENNLIRYENPFENDRIVPNISPETLNALPMKKIGVGKGNGKAKRKKRNDRK